MASPFPGMDPFLEGDLWQEFHETLAGAIRAQLMSKISPKYVALLAKRYVLDRPGLGILDIPRERVVYPNVHVTHAGGHQKNKPPSGSSVALAPAVTEPTVELLSPMLEEVPILNVEIRDVAQRRLVTLIEILSPVNKHGDGYHDYLSRRLDLMQTTTHLLEIDLLRQGKRLSLYGELPPATYYVYLSRATHRPHTGVWTIDLRQALPVVPVPLLPPDPDVTLDLQAAVRACFDLVGYERLLNYHEPLPPPALNEAETVWVAEQVQQQE